MVSGINTSQFIGQFSHAVCIYSSDLDDGSLAYRMSYVYRSVVIGRYEIWLGLIALHVHLNHSVCSFLWVGLVTDSDLNLQQCSFNNVKCWRLSLAYALKHVIWSEYILCHITSRVSIELILWIADKLTLYWAEVSSLRSRFRVNNPVSALR